MAHRGSERSRATKVGLFLGPVLFLAVALLPIGEMGARARCTAAVTLWMAVWWVTEAAPLAITALLPLVMFPLLQVRPIGAGAPQYTRDIIFLFFGGFVLALAVEKSGLHRRLALTALHVIGKSPRRLVWGFLLVTAGLSMWLSNTATTLMLLPIATAVVERVQDGKTPSRMLLAVAFGASIGGLGTLIGTPANLVLAGMAPNLVPGLPAVTFGQWMLFGLPIVGLMLPIGGLLLARGVPSASMSGGWALDEERRSLGPWLPAERRAALVFALVAFAWVTRSGLTLGDFRIPGWSHALADPKLVSDAVPAIAGAVVVCLLPSGRGGSRPLVTWEEVRHGVPWGILLLFGGGFAVAGGFRSSGLDAWLVGRLHALAGLPLALAVLIVVALTAFVTNLTSNTATATLVIPVAAAFAEAIHTPAYVLMAAATVAASLAFVLPVATPPNAIVMGSGLVRASDLFKEGLRLNVLAVVVVTLLCLLLAPLVLPV